MGQQEAERAILETDPRFPSGPWRGFWLQKGLCGRQWMQRLSLVFRDGCIEGQGRDWVGRFLFEGRYSVKDGKCVLWKRYLGAHEVLYSGWNEGARLWLWGTWEIVGQDRGGFHLWPEGQQDPTGLSLEQEVDQPVEEQILV